MNKRIRLMLLILIFLIVILQIIFYKQIFQGISDFLVVKDDLYPVDVIHVIAGDDYRSEYAIHLYKQGYAKYIFFSGGWCKYHGYFHGIHGKELAIKNGIPEEAIVFDDSEVKSTFDEVSLLKIWIDNNPERIKTVMIVSDPFHMRRSNWTVKKIFGGDIEKIMAPVPIEQTNFVRNWWQDKFSTRFIFDEYIKIIYYFFRYQLSINWLRFLDTE